MTYYPAIHSSVFKTDTGTPYLKGPGVVMLAAPRFDNEGLEGFLNGFDAELEFDDYLADDTISDGAELCKTAGQLCYLSFSEKRTLNRDAAKYFENILSSGHGSVLEHANYSMLFYGVSRSLTHELVRHRVGVGISQVSQRYVSGKTLRFVERPEYQNSAHLHEFFETRIDRAAAEYDMLAAALTESMMVELAMYSKTEKRKAVNQAARSLLPNETEAPIIVTGNVRAWRHILEMRCSKYAEPEIRAAAYALYQCLVQQEPILFADYEVVELADGSKALKTNTAKV